MDDWDARMLQAAAQRTTEQRMAETEATLRRLLAYEPMAAALYEILVRQSDGLAEIGEVSLERVRLDATSRANLRGMAEAATVPMLLSPKIVLGLLRQIDAAEARERALREALELAAALVAALDCQDQDQGAPTSLWRALELEESVTNAKTAFLSARAALVATTTEEQ